MNDDRMLELCRRLDPPEAPCKHSGDLDLPCRRCLAHRLRQRVYVEQKGEAWKETT